MAVYACGLVLGCLVTDRMRVSLVLLSLLLTASSSCVHGTTAGANDEGQSDPDAPPDTHADFPSPYPGCLWLPSLEGGFTDSGPCNATSEGSCAPGQGFVSTHTLACSPPPGVAVRPELLVFMPGGAPANYSLLLSTAARWGFRSISPTFNNIDAPNSICDGGPGHFGYTGGGDKARANQTMPYPNCMFDIEQERLFGVEHFNSSLLAWRQKNWDDGCRKTASCPGCSPNGSTCHPYNAVAQNESIVPTFVD